MSGIDKKTLLLESERVYLRPVREDDITSEYVGGLNDPEVNKFLVNVRLQKQTKKKVTDFVLYNLRSPYDILLGVFLKEHRIFIGTIRIGDISDFHYFCTIGICFFNKKYWGKGYALESLKCTVEFIFDKLDMHYIEAGVYARNTPSVNLFMRANFSVKNVCRNKFRYGNTFAEVKMFGRINSNFDYGRLDSKALRTKRRDHENS